MRLFTTKAITKLVRALKTVLGFAIGSKDGFLAFEGEFPKAKVLVEGVLWSIHILSVE